MCIAGTVDVFTVPNPKQGRGIRACTCTGRFVLRAEDGISWDTHDHTWGRGWRSAQTASLVNPWEFRYVGREAR